MESTDDADFLNKFKRKKSNFKATFSVFSEFLRDWCGVEYEYASKLLQFTEKSSFLSQLSKINHSPVQDTLTFIKNYLSLSYSAHNDLSKALEVISAQEIPRFKWDFKETCTELLEAGKISSQEYRNKLAFYASTLVNSTESVSGRKNENLQQAKELMQEAKEKNLNTLKDIRENMKFKAIDLEESLREKIVNAVEKKIESVMSTPREYSEKVLDDKENAMKIVEAWLAPRVKETHEQLEKLIEDQNWEVRQSRNVVSITVSSIEVIIKELHLKCKNSLEFWEEYIVNFIKDITEKIAKSSYQTIATVKKPEMPQLSYLLSSTEAFASDTFFQFFNREKESNPNVVFQICLRLESLLLLVKKIPSLFMYLDSSSEAFNHSISSVKFIISHLLENLAYRTIKIELAQVFISLYDPYGITYHLPTVREYFAKVAQSLPEEVFAEFMTKTFIHFMESWKISVLRSKPNKSPDEMIKDLKQDIKAISIFFESKQSDGSVKGIPRIAQKEYLENNFDTISLCINPSESLMKRFQSTESAMEKASIAWILLSRNERLGLKFLIENRSKLLKP